MNLVRFPSSSSTRIAHDPFLILIPIILTTSFFSIFVVDAFVACGGNSDRSGNVERDRLVKIVKEDFGLTIDIQSLIDKFENESGQLSFDE